MPPRSGIAADLVAEGARMARICNACRYCEGYCAVFPALERRLDFAEGDLAYLANLCHNCGSCYYACQYAPPHEFALDFPRMLADVRDASYRKYAWPDAFARIFERNAVVACVVAVATFALLLIGVGYAAGAAWLFTARPDAPGAFYAVIPHAAMAWSFGIVFVLAIAAICVGIARFWREGGDPHDRATVASLRDGLAEGCTYPDERPSRLRRVFHHLTFYGFMLCFAATCVATVYHYALHRLAPYPFGSWPVLLGTIGGVGLIVGPAGLLWLKAARDPALRSSKRNGMDAAFLVLLPFVSATGLALLAFRETAAMASLLALHLAAVMALFLTLPYGKFVHGAYRLAALVRFHLERKRPLPDIAPE